MIHSEKRLKQKKASAHLDVHGHSLRSTFRLLVHPVIYFDDLFYH
jgi:hypothetical protein